MKTYIVNIETRKNDRDCVLGPFVLFENAQKALKEYMCMDDIEEYTEFDSDFSKGQIYTEEESAEIIERELK